MNELNTLKEIKKDLPIVSYGVCGEAVKMLQTVLMEFGYFDDAVDGRALVSTVKAIKAFQTDNGVTVDGYFGPECWDLLLSDENDISENKEDFIPVTDDETFKES